MVPSHSHLLLQPDGELLYLLLHEGLDVPHHLLEAAEAVVHDDALPAAAARVVRHHGVRPLPREHRGPPPRPRAQPRLGHGADAGPPGGEGGEGGAAPPRPGPEAGLEGPDLGLLLDADHAPRPRHRLAALVAA